MTESSERKLTIDARVLRGPLVRSARDKWVRIVEADRQDGISDESPRWRVAFCEEILLEARLPGVTHLDLTLAEMAVLGLDEPGPQPRLPVDLSTITRSDFAALLTKWGLEVRKFENVRENLGWSAPACLWSALTGKSLMAGEGL